MAYGLVIFDLGGVMVDFEADRLVHQVAQLLGRSFEEVQAAVYHEELLLPFELGRIRPQVYYNGLKDKLRLSWSYERFVKAWNDVLRENSDVTGMLRRLHTRHQLMALSNTNELHLNHMKTTIPSLAILDHWVASSDVGVRKPDPRIYQLALELAGVRAREAVYVDDRPELVEAGRAVGLTAIRFESGRQLEREFQAIGIDC